MSIVDDLIAHPGTYIGLNRDTQSRDAAAAKIVVTRLPGGAGVTIDYETLNPAHEERVRGHVEHAIVAKTDGGGAILVTGHIHANTVAVLRESEPGVFVMGSEPSAFPVQIKISMPEPGRLLYVWAYGMPGEEPIDRDAAELTLVS